MTPFHDWETFYVIVGSSAAALTGLQFVVIALTADRHHVGGEQEVNAFATPTVVHLCAVFAIAALIAIPGQSASSLAICLGLLGAAGLAYAITVVARARQQTGYRPVFSDWMWHGALPIVAYAVLLTAGIVAARHTEGALYVTAAAALALLFIAIHNAWDAAVYISTSKADERKH